MSAVQVRAAAMAAALLAWGAAGGCKRERQVAAENTVVVEQAPDPSTIHVPRPEEFPVVTVTTRAVPDELLVNGVIAPDVSRNVPVVSMASGRVVDIRARLGDDVTKGQLLLEINSPDLQQAISDYKKFQADEALAKRQLERAQLLYSHGALAQKDLQVAEDTEQKALVDVETSRDRIRLLGGDLNQLTPIVRVYAPVSGSIVEQNVAGAGGVKSLDNSPNLFTIADLSRVWLLCDVYENNLGQVRVGDSAEVRMNAYPDRLLRGRVANISSMLDPATRTAKVRIELPNDARLLRPGMFASARFVSRGRATRVVVPATALLRLHDRDWVFVPSGPKAFHRVEVRSGLLLPDGYQEIASGIEAGQQVVSNALQLASVPEEPPPAAPPEATEKR